MQDEGIPGMRADSFEWICSKLRVRTYQGLTETFGLPADDAKLKKKKMSRECKMTLGNIINKSVQGTSSLRLH